MDLRVFGFGDLTGGPWGAAWIPAESDQAEAALLGSLSTSVPGPPRLEGEQPDENWNLHIGATELALEGVGEPIWSEQAAGFDQLCQVTGVLDDGSGPRNVRSLGWRSARPQPLSSGPQVSLRQVAGWFEPDEGFALLAVRSPGAKGQDGDEISAALFGPGGPRPVADPRLSTTYTNSEQPTRASVELWVEMEGDPESQYPRRSIGEAVATASEARAGAVALDARPFRWHSTGQEGAGLYLIGRAA